MAALPLLRHLDLRANRITTLPSWLADLPALEKLDLRWNPLTPDPDPALLAGLAERGCIVLT